MTDRSDIKEPCCDCIHWKLDSIDFPCNDCNEMDNNIASYFKEIEPYWVIEL